MLLKCCSNNSLTLLWSFSHLSASRSIASHSTPNNSSHSTPVIFNHPTLLIFSHSISFRFWTHLWPDSNPAWPATVQFRTLWTEWILWSPGRSSLLIFHTEWWDSVVPGGTSGWHLWELTDGEDLPADLLLLLYDHLYCLWSIIFSDNKKATLLFSCDVCF